MAFRVKDLPRAGEALNAHFERAAEAQGRRVADLVLSQTSQGRGLWVLFLWPAWVLIFLFSGVFLEGLVRKFGVAPPLSWAGFLGGLVVATLWYGSDFTRRHPFWGSVFGYLGTALAVTLLADKLGL